MRLSSFCPTWTASSVTAISPEFFREHGIRGVILDLDNTLVPWRGAEISAEVAAWVHRMRAAGLRLCIVSNTHRPERLHQLAAAFAIPYIPGSTKPRRRGFLQALAVMDTTPTEAAVVGDQVMTDIWGGNRCGLMTVLVERLTRQEFLGTLLINRPLEALLLERLRRQGLLKPVPEEPATGEVSHPSGEMHASPSTRRLTTERSEP
jgi:HAD superfamily phosphatase (TIGR01668 family)